jgi:hypothetical protein
MSLGYSETKRALERHLWGVPRAARAPRWIVPVLDLRAAIDDSGSARRDPYYALAGFIAHKHDWDNFTDEWQEVIDGPPPIRYFKRSEAFRHENEFENWNQPDIDARVSKAVSITKRHVMVRVSRALRRADYERHFRGTMPDAVDDPYFLLFYSLIYGVMLYQNKYGWDTKVDFIFDEQSAIGTRSRDWYAEFCKMAQPIKKLLPPEPLFLDDEFFYPLQAADLYAWNVRRNLLDNDVIYMPPSYELPELDNLQKIDHVLDVAGIASIRDDINASLRRP